MGPEPGRGIVGNGQGLKPEDIDALAKVALDNFGVPDQVFMPPNIANHIMKVHFQSSDIPWNNHFIMNRRERVFAKLHRFLYKLKISDDKQNNDWTIEKAKERLQEAKWASLVLETTRTK